MGHPSQTIPPRHNPKHKTAAARGRISQLVVAKVAIIETVDTRTVSETITSQVEVVVEVAEEVVVGAEGTLMRLPLSPAKPTQRTSGTIQASTRSKMSKFRRVAPHASLISSKRAPGNKTKTIMAVGLVTTRRVVKGGTKEISSLLKLRAIVHLAPLSNSNTRSSLPSKVVSLNQIATLNFSSNSNKDSTTRMTSSKSSTLHTSLATAVSSSHSSLSLVSRPATATAIMPQPQTKLRRMLPLSTTTIMTSSSSNYHSKDNLPMPISNS